MKHLKQEFDKLSFKDTLMYAIVIASITAGFALIFCALFIPPKGEIHESVLMAFGIILVFVGTVLGLDMKYANVTASFKKAIIEMVASLHDEKRNSEEPVDLSKK